MNLLGTLLGVALSPLFAVVVFAVGVLLAVIHLLAMPVLYLWERYLEDHPAVIKEPTAHRRSEIGGSAVKDEQHSSSPVVNS